MSWDVLDFDTNTTSDHHSLISCDISDSEEHMDSSVAKTSWLCFYMSQRQHNLSSHKEIMESCDPDYFDYRNGECMQGISDEEGSASSSLSSTIQDAAFKVVLGYSCSPASEAASEFIVPMLKSYDQVQMVAHNPPNRKVLHSRAETLAKVIPNLSIIEDTSNRRPSSILMEYSNESQAELIVCGASQHNSMHRALFGDTVMELVKQAEQAVLIVSASTLCRRERSKPHKWMLCVDGSTGSLRSAALLGRCLLPHDEVHIFTCVSAEPNGMSRSMIRAKEAEVNDWMPGIWHSLSHRLEPNIHVVYSCKPASQVALEWASKNEMSSIVCGRNFHEEEHSSSFVFHIVQNAQSFNVLVA